MTPTDAIQTLNRTEYPKRCNSETDNKTSPTTDECLRNNRHTSVSTRESMDGEAWNEEGKDGLTLQLRQPRPIAVEDRQN